MGHGGEKPIYLVKRLIFLYSLQASVLLERLFKQEFLSREVRTESSDPESD